MSKTVASIAVTIFVTGLITGIFFGIALKTGQDVDPESLSIFVFKTVCDATPKVPNTSFLMSCDFTVAFLTMVVFIVGVLEIIGTANSIGDWRIGLLIYAAGFFVGIIMIYQ